MTTKSFINEHDNDINKIDDKNNDLLIRKKIRIVGGGLAGLSIAYHLLKQQPPPTTLMSTKENQNNITERKKQVTKHQKVNVDITIDDIVQQVGQGGASAIAGGLLHPLSPRGKLVHWGLEGLAATNDMVEHAIDAVRHQTESNATNSSPTADMIRLRNELYRIAVSNEQEKQLQEIAMQYPTIAEWSDDIYDQTKDSNQIKRTSGLRLYNGCCVLHVPSYLSGVYQACQIEARNSGSTILWRHINQNQVQDIKDDNDDQIVDDHFDVTVYCYGSNMFQQRNDNNNEFDFTPLSSQHDRSAMLFSDMVDTTDTNSNIQFPVQLVRGQSMEVQLSRPLNHALLCGKYVSPLPKHNNPDNKHYYALIGATHEFSRIPLTFDEVKHDLQSRTSDFVPFQYNNNDDESCKNTMNDASSNHVIRIDRITCGYRVQSTRGAYGRRPIIGQLYSKKSTTALSSLDTSNQNHVSTGWVFTGLSSRGLLYHALYGQMLAHAIIHNDESILLNYCSDLLWWKK